MMAPTRYPGPHLPLRNVKQSRDIPWQLSHSQHMARICSCQLWPLPHLYPAGTTFPTFSPSSSMARYTHPLTLPMTCSRSIHLSPLYMTISSTGLLSPLVSNSWVVFLGGQLLPYLNLPEPGRKSAKPPERISGVRISNYPSSGNVLPT
jgi:hypothetical protein